MPSLWGGVIVIELIGLGLASLGKGKLNLMPFIDESVQYTVCKLAQ